MDTQQLRRFKFLGSDATILGTELRAGMPAPEFSVTAPNWSSVRGLESTRNKVRIIGALPSINTSVCDREARRLNYEVSLLSPEITVLLISMDLPWTLRNWGATSGVERLQLLSDHKTGEFGQKYTVLLVEPRVLRRAIFVVDRNDTLVYARYMPTLGDEPDYPEVIAAAEIALTVE